MVMTFRNPRYNQFGTIDIEVEDPERGWMPFTASPDDPEQHGRDMHAAVIAAGHINPYVAPPEPTAEEARAAMPALTRRQFRLGMRDLGITSSMIDAGILSITDEDAREIAQIEWEDATSFERLHPMVVMLSTAFEIAPEALDAAWSEAAGY